MFCLKTVNGATTLKTHCVLVLVSETNTPKNSKKLIVFCSGSVRNRLIMNLGDTKEEQNEAENVCKISETNVFLLGKIYLFKNLF